MPQTRFLSTPSARRATPFELCPQRSKRFLSTPSARRATKSAVGRSQTPQYFYPRPPRGGRRFQFRFRCLQQGFLSTPSARRATIQSTIQSDFALISIHALREEGDFPSSPSLPAAIRFLSTPSARRATSSKSSIKSSLYNFYPRPPRGGRQILHAFQGNLRVFLSTPSARRATTRPFI